MGRPAGALRPGGPMGPYSLGLSPAGPLALRMKGVRVSARSDLCLLTGRADSAYSAAAAGGTIPPTGSPSPTDLACDVSNPCGLGRVRWFTSPHARGPSPLSQAKRTSLASSPDIGERGGDFLRPELRSRAVDVYDEP